MRERATMVGRLLIAASCFAAPSTAQPGRQSSEAPTWAACQQAPTRRCVLQHAVEVGRSGFLGSPDLRGLRIVATAQAAAGLAHEASETVDLLKADNDVSRVLFAQVKAAAGKLDEAARLAGMVSDPMLRGLVTGSIAAAEGKDGSIDAALRRVQAVQGIKERAVAVRRAAWEMRFAAAQRGEDGKIVEALRQVQSIDVSRSTHPSTRVPALQIIVDAQVRTGKVAEAVELARSVEPSSDRSRVFGAIVKFLAGAGRVSEALRIALATPRSDQFLWEATSSLNSMVPMLSEERPKELGSLVVTTDSDLPTTSPQGKVDAEALAVARSFPTTEGRDTALRVVAEAHANAGEPARAAEAAALIDDLQDRSDALFAVGLAQARAGQRALAAATFGEAAQIAAKRIAARDEASRTDFSDQLFYWLGRAEAKADLIAEAMHHEETIQDRHGRAVVLSDIARAQARAGMTAEALQTAKLSKTLGFHAFPGGEAVVVAGLAEGGHVGAAVQTAEQFLLLQPFDSESHLQRQTGIRSAAVSLARAGNAAGALQLAQVQVENARIETLAQVALALRQTGEAAGAATAIRVAMESARSAQEFAELSYALPD